MVFALIKQIYVNHKPEFLGGKHNSFTIIVFLKTVHTFRRLKTVICVALQYSIDLNRYWKPALLPNIQIYAIYPKSIF